MYNKKKSNSKRKVCYFTKNKIEKIDYKRVDILVKFISPTGKITPSRTTGTSARYQRMLRQAIMRARFMGLLPYVND